LAENINAQLDQMSLTLKTLVDKINNKQARTDDNENQIHQIVRVLNSHLNSLQWIDQSTNQLQNRLSEIGKSLQLHQIEQERFVGFRGR
jgi:nuclear pore complex protein Nup62